MEKFNWEEKRKVVEEKALSEHKRLHRLFKDNPFAFELEKRRMINEIIDQARGEDQKKKLRAIQESWDNKMKNAGSKQNRFIIAQNLFWDHVENIWNPFLQGCSRELSGLVEQKK